MTRELIDKLRKKAMTSTCKYRVAAIGLNKRGEVIYSSSNKPRFSRLGGSIHAEMQVMHKAGPGLHTILLCRVGHDGELRNIAPCDTCAAKARELGVRIVEIA